MAVTGNSEETITSRRQVLSARLPVLSSTEVIKALAKVVIRGQGSHIVLVNRKTKKVPLDSESKRDPKRNVRAII